MYELKVENHRGDLLNLTETDDYTVYKITGLTPPNAIISSSEHSTTDGARINNVRLGSRNIVIYLSINGDIEENRIGLYKYFPPKKAITLYFKNGKRNVTIEGVVELIECDLFVNRQVAQISILCPMPYFKDVEYLVTEFGDINNLLTFPFNIEETGTQLSEMVTNQRKTILNTGDVEAGMIISLKAIGSVTNPVLYNVLTGERMQLNFTMQSGDAVTINTYINQKSIMLMRNGVEQNIIGYMSPDSSFFVLEAGDNVFTYDAQAGKASLQISFTTSLLYGGV